jgi:hypothetical protein
MNVVQFLKQEITDGTSAPANYIKIALLLNKKKAATHSTAASH